MSEEGGAEEQEVKRFGWVRSCRRQLGQLYNRYDEHTISGTPSRFAHCFLVKYTVVLSYLRSIAMLAARDTHVRNQWVKAMELRLVREEYVPALT